MRSASSRARASGRRLRSQAASVSPYRSSWAANAASLPAKRLCTMSLRWASTAASTSASVTWTPAFCAARSINRRSTYRSKKASPWAVISASTKSARAIGWPSIEPTGAACVDAFSAPSSPRQPPSSATPIPSTQSPRIRASTPSILAMVGGSGRPVNAGEKTV